MKNKVRRILTPLLLGVFLAMMISGILRGEPLNVFRKAVRICLECIGIG